MTNRVVGTLSECPHCHTEDVNVYKEDAGIGSYEFWGQKCHDTRWVYCCETCDEEVDFEEEEPEYIDDPEPPEDDPVQHDADVLRSAGMGTDEDYGYYGDNDGY